MEEDMEPGYVSVRSDSLPFLRIHFAAFLSQYHKELSTRLTEAAIREHLKERDNDSQPFSILDSKYEESVEMFLVLEKGTPLKNAEWYSEEQGRSKWGEEFLRKIAEFQDDLDRKEDPDWTPSSR